MSPRNCIGVAALGFGPAFASDVPPAVPHHGFVCYEFNKWLFRPCRDNRTAEQRQAPGVPLTDATHGGILFRAIQQRRQQSTDPPRDIYLEFDGYLENGRVTATRLQRSLDWVESCAKVPTNIAKSIRGWAMGNEPAWSFSTDGRVDRIAGVEGATAVEGLSERSEDHMTALWGGAEGRRFRIEFTETLCGDTMSEAVFGYTVIAAVDGHLLTGCGLLRDQRSQRDGRGVRGRSRMRRAQK